MAVKNEFDINDFSMKGLRKVANENGKELLKGNLYLKGRKWELSWKRGEEQNELTFLDAKAEALYFETENKWNKMLRVFYKGTPLEYGHRHTELVEVLIDLKMNFEGAFKKAVLQEDFDCTGSTNRNRPHLEKFAVQPKVGLTEAVKSQIEADELIDALGRGVGTSLSIIERTKTRRTPLHNGVLFVFCLGVRFAKIC